jgi:hypothetical protein
MRTLNKFFFLFLLFLSACNLPIAGTTSEPAPGQPTDAPSEDYNYTECGFVWSREPLEQLSKEFDAALKTVEPGAGGRAEAYGENCLNNRGKVVRFLAMETDFYVLLKVEQLQDKQALGNLLEEVLSVVAQFPVEETPGPQPGYVGVTFEAPTDELRLWFPQREAEAALENGLRGAELFEALQAK